MTREIVIDTETTGLNHRLGDRIIEVACVELYNHVSTGKTMQFYCFTEKKIEESAQKIHGLTNSFLNKFKTFQEQAQEFLDFIRNDTLIIHNADFDMGFLNNELKIMGVETIKNNIIDTVKLARKTLNTRIANLDYLCKRMSIDLSKRSFHGALLDCHLLSEVYLELKGGRQSSLELSTNEKKEKSKKEKKTQLNNDIQKIILTDNELAEHKKLIGGLKNALWNKVGYGKQ